MGGSTVTAATLHNADQVGEKDVRPGDLPRASMEQQMADVKTASADLGSSRKRVLKAEQKLKLLTTVVMLGQIAADVLDNYCYYCTDKTN